MAIFTIILLGVLLFPVTNSTIIQVPALGRTSDLLFFYNAKEDQFIPVSALTGHLPLRSTLPQVKGNVQCTSKIVKTLDDRLSSLGLSLKSKIDVLTGVVGMSGSIEFAKETQFRAESVIGVVHYKRYTMYESVHSRLPEIQNLISMFPASVLGATHVVIGEMWGVDILISFEFRNQKNSSSLHSEMEFEASLNKLAYSVGVGAKAGSTNSASHSSYEADIKIFGDLLIPSIPRTIEEVEALLQSIPEILKNTSDKGSPQYFDVIEIDKIQRIINHDIRARQFQQSKEVTESERRPDVVALETSLLLVLQDADQIRKDTELWVSRIQGIEFIFDDQFLNLINRHYAKFETTHEIFLSKFKRTIQLCRSRRDNRYTKRYHQIKKQYSSHRYGPRKFKKLIAYFIQLAKPKYFDYLALKKNGVLFGSKYGSVNHIRLNHASEQLMLLFYTPELKLANFDKWDRLTNWLAVQSGVRYVIDCSLRNFIDSCVHTSTIEIQIYGNGTETQEKFPTIQYLRKL